MHEAVGVLLDGEATDALAARFLTALREKGETADELEGTVRAVRDRMTPWESGFAPRLHCSTPAEPAATAPARSTSRRPRPSWPRLATFRSSSTATGQPPAALAARTCWPPWAWRMTPSPRSRGKCLAEVSLAFLFAPRYHPGLARLAPVRRSLPFRTVFNLIGPLCNPASPAHQLIGVPDDTHAGLLAEVLVTPVPYPAGRRRHRRRRARRDHARRTDDRPAGRAGPSGADPLGPEDFGLAHQHAGSLVVRDARESAERLIRLFEGERGPARDYVIANTAAALHVATGCTLLEGAARAGEAIDSGGCCPGAGAIAGTCAGARYARALVGSPRTFSTHLGA